MKSTFRPRSAWFQNRWFFHPAILPKTQAQRGYVTDEASQRLSSGFESRSSTPGIPRWHSGKESACQCRTAKTQVGFLDQEYPLEEEMANCSSILAWKTPWTEETGGLQTMRLQSQTWLRDWACLQSQAFLVEALEGGATKGSAIHLCSSLSPPTWKVSSKGIWVDGRKLQYFWVWQQSRFKVLPQGGSY